MAMTTLEEEDELFGANLSVDFEAPSSRPWQSSAARANGHATVLPSKNNYQDGRDCDPYELLDDVAPAVIPSNSPSGQDKDPFDLLDDESGNCNDSGFDPPSPRPTAAAANSMWRSRNDVINGVSAAPHLLSTTPLVNITTIILPSPNLEVIVR